MTAFGGTFGEDFSAGWGEPDSDVPSEHSEAAPSGDIGDGHSMVINEDAWTAMMHSQVVGRAVVHRAQAIADAANASANDSLDARAIQRLNPNGEDAFVVTVHNDESTSRVRASVHASRTNELGFVADAQDSSLYKAMIAVSDGGASDSAPGEDSIVIPEVGGL